MKKLRAHGSMQQKLLTACKVLAVRVYMCGCECSCVCVSGEGEGTGRE